MTINEFNELKIGDKVMYGGEVHTIDYCKGSNKHIIDIDGYGTIIDAAAAPNLTLVEKKENAELKKDKEDLIFIRNQKAACMCEDKQRLTEAKEIIKSLMDIINHDLKCFDTIAGVDVKQKAEQFLKDTTDIREASTYKGDWVVDEH